MNKLFFWVLMASCILNVCCSTDKQLSELHLKAAGTHSLELDSVSGHNYISFHVLPVKNSLKAVILNTSNQTIYLYDWATGKIEFRQPIDQEKSGIKTGMADGAIISPDGQLYYYSDNLFSFYRISGENVKRISKNVDINSPDGEQYFDFPKFYALFQPVFTNDGLLLVSNGISNRAIQDYTKIHSALIYNLSNDDDEVMRKITFPEFYNHGRWGRDLGYDAYHCLSADGESFITSFAKSDSLFLTNIHTWERSSRFGGSSYFSMKDQEPSSKSTDTQMDFQSGMEYDFTHPAYFFIRYDPATARYYRLAQVDFPSKETVAKNHGELRLGISYSFIVFDKSLNKLGEALLPDVTKYNMNLCFMQDGFIYIAPLPNYQKDENKLEFEKFEVVGL